MHAPTRFQMQIAGQVRARRFVSAAAIGHDLGDHANRYMVRKHFEVHALVWPDRAHPGHRPLRCHRHGLLDDTMVPSHLRPRGAFLAVDSHRQLGTADQERTGTPRYVSETSSGSYGRWGPLAAAHRGPHAGASRRVRLQPGGVGGLARDAAFKFRLLEAGKHPFHASWQSDPAPSPDQIPLELHRGRSPNVESTAGTGPVWRRWRWS